MSSPYAEKPVWKIVYTVWPPILRLMEFVGVHTFRQEYLLGHLSPKYSPEDFARLLSEQGFETAICAWKDPGEVVGMRKLDTPLYQYHVRLFEDGEIRCHYEYSPEAKPVEHSLEKGFEFRREFFE